MPKETFINLSQEKQEKIIMEAIKEFAYKGFGNGNIGQIAKNAGIAKGSMYQYFYGKRELYLFCLQKAYKISLNSTRLGNYDKIPIYDYIVDSFKTSWPFIHEHYEIYLFLQNAIVDGSTFKINNNEIMDLLIKAGEEFMIDLIEKNKKSGFIRSDIDTKTIMFYLEAVSIKLKQEMLNLAKNNNKGILDTTFEDYEYLINDMVKLLKTGMGRV